MLARPVMLLAAAAVAFAGPTVAQTPPGPPSGPAAASAPIPTQSFPPGAEVLSVDGEPLGVLAEVELRAGGERILHIRRADGSMATAPAAVASRGERAVVLEWTSAQFESPAARTAAAEPPATPSPVM